MRWERGGRILGAVKDGAGRVPEQALSIFFFFLKIYLFIYFWLRWVSVVVRGLSLVAASGGYSSLRCRGLLIAVASLVAEHGL